MEKKLMIYNFSGVTYGEVDQVIELLKLHDGVTAFVIKHDKDVIEDIENRGQPKQEHIHFVIKCKNAHTISAVKKWLYHENEEGREEHVLVQECQSLKASVRYLLHRDNPEKYQYSIEDIQYIGGMKAQRLAQDYLCDDGEEDRQYQVVMDIVNYDINWQEAMKRAPELFIHKPQQMKTLIKILRVERIGRDLIDDELRKQYENDMEV